MQNAELSHNEPAGDNQSKLQLEKVKKTEYWAEVSKVMLDSRLKIKSL